MTMHEPEAWPVCRAEGKRSCVPFLTEGGPPPDHRLCPEVAAASVYRYAEQRWGSTPKQIAYRVFERLFRYYPLPAGATALAGALYALTVDHALEEAIDRDGNLDLDSFQSPIRAAFDLPALVETNNDAMLALVIERRTPSGIVRLLATTTLHGGPAAIPWHYGAGVFSEEHVTLAPRPMAEMARRGEFNEEQRDDSKDVAETRRVLADWYARFMMGQRVEDGVGDDGRPVWSGTFSSPEECRAAMTLAIQALWERGKDITQGAVADYFHTADPNRFTNTNDRRIRDWCKAIRLDWKRVKETALAER